MLLKYQKLKTLYTLATNCINELKENKPVLSLSPEYMVKIHQYQTKFTQHFLKSFLPQISQENMTTLELSLTLSMHGFNYAIAQSFEYKNLLEQGTNNFQNNFRHSKKMVNFAKENFPEAEFMEPIRMEVNFLSAAAEASSFFRSMKSKFFSEVWCFKISIS